MARAKKKAHDNLLARTGSMVQSPRGQLLIRALLASGVLLAVSLVMKEARAFSYSLPKYRVTQANVRVVNIPKWMTRDAFQAQHPARFSRFQVSIYDADAENTIISHLVKHPLVRRVDEVRVRYPRSADARVTFRVPVAKIRLAKTGKDGKRRAFDRYLSDDGCLLPAAPYQRYLEQVGYELPYVRGIRARPLPAPGSVWEDRHEQVAEAVEASRLAKMIYEAFAGRLTVKKIDVSRFPAPISQRHEGEVRLTIMCPPDRRGGTRVERDVEWGRTDRARSRVQGEDDQRTKLRRLRRLLTQRLPGRYLDVRDDPLIDMHAPRNWR